ncbi:hypothetical protein ANN_02306 [Periplaneta americana]|uniref:Uncharacterized protein n=1 Tax=Periplaneta americana TaxID=6978 RepID=A0ABQ8TZC9_PERAM|nr:hypothetical protein ANN_02306 [Periplaneta americana]
MDSMFLPVILVALMAAAGSTLNPSPRSTTSQELHAGAATYNSNRRLVPRQLVLQANATDPGGKRLRSLDQRGTKQDYGSRVLSSTPDVSDEDTRQSLASDERVLHTRDARTAPDEGDSMMMAGAGRRKNTKAKRGDDDDDDEEKKTLSQQIADGKYGLIEKEIYSTTPKRPGIISYATNPEVPRDTAKNLGGLEPEEIWLAENHVLVLRGGFFPEHKFNRTDETATAWPPIDDFKAPPRQVKIPANPKVPPPFPVQLTDDGPTQFIGFNGSAGPPPFPPFFPQPPPGNGSYFAPPFPLPPSGNFTPGFYPPIPPGNFSPGGGFYPPPGNGSFSPPRFPYPLPPPRNGSYFVPPPGNFTPGSGPFRPPPFPGYPPLPQNASLYPPYPRPGIFPPPPPPNGTLPFPPPFFQNLPPGAAFLPPPGNLTEPFDEDDPSLYYPPPYDFYYPQDNSTEVPPGPLVPGIILPPPPNFFAPLNNHSEEHTPPPTTTKPPVTSTYRPSVTKDRRPSFTYLPVNIDIRKKKPRPTVNVVDNHVTPVPEIYVLTTPAPEIQDVDRHSEKPPRPPNNVAPKNVQVTHQGKSPVEPIPQQGYYYEKPTVVVTPAPEVVYDNGYNNVKDVVLTTAVPGISFYTVPVTDIIVKPTPTPQRNEQPAKTRQKEPRVQAESPRSRGKQVNIPTTTLSPLLVYYNSQRQPQDIESNTVTPSPQPYYVKTKSGVTATLAPPVLYYTVPSVEKSRDPSPVKTSFYFYEEPHEGSQVNNVDPSTTTQAPLVEYKKPATVPPQPHYDTPSPRGKAVSQKVQPQYTYSEVAPEQPVVKGTVQTGQPQYEYPDEAPVNQPVKGSTQVKGVQQRIRQQQYVLSSVLPVGQQVIFPSRGKLPQSSTPAPPPQYYYVTASPGLQYNIVGSTTPSPLNQDYPIQSPQQEYVKPTSQPLPAVSKLAYFTTPRPDFAYQNIISSQRPILYNIQPSPTPRPIYQYSFETNSKNIATQQPLQENLYTTPRTRPKQPQRVNYQTGSQAAVVLPVQYQTTPRTLFEYSYQQRGLSTKAPEVQGFYSAVGAQYDEQEDVTAGSPATHYGYEDSRENAQGYQTTPRPRYKGYENHASQVNIYPTSNPLHAYFTQQDESLLDDITKKYFTIFGQKLPSGDDNVPTTPIPPYSSGNIQSHVKQPYTAKTERQYYTTPIPQYNYQNSEQPPPEDINKRPISIAGDTDVNYKKPSPPVNPFSEYIDQRQLSNADAGGALVSYKFPGDGGHFYFITPQVVGVQQSQQQASAFVYPVSGQAPHELGIRYRRKKRKEQR